MRWHGGCVTIPIEDCTDPDEWRGIKERCCFCRKPTDWWTAIKSRKPGEQVACCPKCAPVYRVKDVPSKRHWCETEDKFEEIARRGRSR